MALAVVYDPRFQSFYSWACLMCEAYAAQQLQIPNENDDDWKSWAVGLNAIDLFSNNSIPDPYQFENWYDWASALVNIVNQRVD